MTWKKVKLGALITESRIPATRPDANRRIRVRLNVLGVEKRPLEGEKEGATKQFIRKAGQFIYGKQNFHKGAFGIVPDALDGFESSADIPSFDVRNDCLPEWIFYYFKIGKRYLELEKLARGVGSKRIHPEQLSEIEILLPELHEQKKLIREFYDVENKSQKLSTELTHQLDLVKQLRQAFLREAMQGKLVPQDLNDEPASALLQKVKVEKEKLVKEGKLKKQKELPPIKPEEIPFKIPKSWVWCRLGELSLYSEAGSSFKCVEIPINQNEWGVIKVSAVSWDKFIEDQNKLYSKTKPRDTSAQIFTGDFIISRANTSELVGKSVVVKAITKNLLLSDKTIRFIFSKSVSNDFINQWNNSSHARSYYSSKGTGSSPSMKNITREHMNNLIVPLPPLSEQHRIVTKLEQLMRYCDELEQSIKESQAQNEHLLQQVLREALQPGKEYEIKDALSLAAEE